MTLKIFGIREPGNLEKERVVIRATSDIDIGKFVLFRTGFIDGSINTGVDRTYWFPDNEIRKGDYVIVYSKVGVHSEKTIGDAKSHFFYWASSVPLWDKSTKAAVLLYAPDWQSFNIDSEKPR